MAVYLRPNENAQRAALAKLAAGTRYVRNSKSATSS